MTSSRTALVVRIGVLLGLLGSVACPGTIPDPGAFTAALDAGTEPTVDGASPAAEAGPACPDVPMTVLAKTCAAIGCHDATTKAQALDLVSPGLSARLVGVHSTEGNGLLVDPVTPSASVLYTKLLSPPPFGLRMPSTSTLDKATIACVLSWVQSEAGSPAVVDSGTPTGGDAGTADAGRGETGVTTPFTDIRIAAGQTTAVTDAQGHSWAADADFTGGTAAVEATPVTIAGTDTPALYNGQRYGSPSFSYQFTVPDGAYSVTLKFAELYVTGAGQRIFSVAINGATVEPSLDIYAAAGAMNKAVDRSYPVTVTGGMLKLDFMPGAIQSPKVDAILISQGDGG